VAYFSATYNTAAKTLEGLIAAIHSGKESTKIPIALRGAFYVSSNM
jgi:hypothetical protein